MTEIFLTINTLTYRNDPHIFCSSLAASSLNILDEWESYITPPKLISSPDLITRGFTRFTGQS